MNKLTGVNFESMRYVLYLLFFQPTRKTYEEAKKFILPAQMNFISPLDEGIGKDLTGDTYIQYFISRDTMYTRDRTSRDTNALYKTAIVDIRFIGAMAEYWAKSMHHLAYRKNYLEMIYEQLGGEMLPYVGAITPTVLYWDDGNANVAFDVSMTIKYKETLQLDFSKLEKVEIAKGIIN